MIDTDTLHRMQAAAFAAARRVLHDEPAARAVADDAVASLIRRGPAGGEDPVDAAARLGAAFARGLRLPETA